MVAAIRGWSLYCLALAATVTMLDAFVPETVSYLCAEYPRHAERLGPAGMRAFVQRGLERAHRVLGVGVTRAAVSEHDWAIR